MSDSRHDQLGGLAAAYAIGALDADERGAFEAHLSTCPICQSAVADGRTVSVALGLSVDPIAPPASLRTRTIDRATGRGAAFPRARASRSMSPAVWIAAAAAMLAVIVGLYAWSLGGQMESLRAIAAAEAVRAQALRAELAAARAESDRLSLSTQVLAAADVVRVDMAGTSGAPGSTGRAFWSASRGVVFTGDRLPALTPGRIYQLWLVVPNRAPIGAGLLAVSPQGSGIVISPPPAPLTLPAGSAVTVAITNEPSGGSPGPTTQILLAGSGKVGS